MSIKAKITTGIIILAVILTGCRKTDKDTPKQVKEKLPTGKVLVTVNATTVTQSQVDDEMAPYLERMKTMGRAVPEAQKIKIQKDILNMMVEKQLLTEKIKTKGITVTDEKVNSVIKEITTSQGITIEDFEKSLQTRGGMSMAEFNEKMRMDLSIKELLESEFLKSGESVTEEEAKKFYNDNIKNFTRDEQVKASHILIGTSGKDEAGKTAAKIKAQEVLAQVRGGADFAELAKTQSTCPSKAKGGDLGFIDKSQMVSEFSEVAFALKPDEVSGVVETKFGYHIIKITDRKEAGVSSFEDEKSNILQQLEPRKKQAFAQNYLEGLKSKANIVWAESLKTEVPAVGDSPVK